MKIMKRLHSSLRFDCRANNPHEAQAGIKIVGRNISNLRYNDDTTFMAESEEELKSFFFFADIFFLIGS